MSHLIKEYNDHLIVDVECNGRNGDRTDLYDEWELDREGHHRFSDTFHEQWHYVLEEFTARVKVNKDTGEYEIIAIRDGSDWFDLVPQKEKSSVNS